MIKLVHHLNISYDESIPLNIQKLNILENYYLRMEELSQSENPLFICEACYISRTDAFCIFISGRDLFLAMYDSNKFKLSNCSNITDIEKVKSSQVHELYGYIENIQKGKQVINRPKKLLDLCGNYIPKIRLEETFLSHIPQGIIIERHPEPFILTCRLNPPFKDHDFKVIFDVGNNKFTPYIDEKVIDTETLKLNHPTAHNALSIIEAAGGDRNFSKLHIWGMIKQPFVMER